MLPALLLHLCFPHRVHARLCGYAVWFQLGGLGVWEIALLFAIWSALAVVFELPSGALSDHFDRRWLLVAAPFLKSLTFVCWTLWLLIPLVLAHFVTAPVFVLSEAKFQQVMEGRSRATTTSAVYVVLELASILIILGFGAAAALAGVVSPMRGPAPMFSCSRFGRLLAPGAGKPVSN